MNQSIDDIDYESSVSSNLSFLDNEEQQVPKNQKTKPTKKSNNNSPQKLLTQSKQKEPKEKNSKFEAIEEEEPQEAKGQQQQPQPEPNEAEAAKKKEENTEMEQEEDKQAGEEQEDGDEAIGEEETNNNNAKDSEEENDDEKDDEDQDDEDDGQDAGNNQKEGAGADNTASGNQNQKKKASQQAANANSKKIQQKQKENKSNSNSNTTAGNQGTNKSNNNQNDKTGNKQNPSKTNAPAQSTTNKQAVDTAASTNQKLNQKRNMTQREKEENTPNANQTSNNTANPGQTTTQVQQQSTSVAQQPVKQTKKLGPKFYLYKEGVKLPDLSDQLNQQIEIRVSKEYIHRFNKQYLSRSIWGSDNYSSDSDIVCILLHHGLVRFDSPEIQKDSPYAGVQVYFKISKNRKTYVSQEKNGICSRQNKNYSGFTIKPETRPQEDLNKNAALMSTPSGRKKIKPNSVLQARNILAIPEVNIVFNLSNDPAYKYSIVNFCDKSEESKDWMSHKLQTHALYIETEKERYEISRIPEEEMNLVNEFDAYKFSRVKDPHSIDNEEMQKVAIPLSPVNSEQLYRDLDWSDFKWGSNVVQIKDLQISNLKCFKLYLKNQD